MATETKTHRCDTDAPTRPCCWEARIAELKAMKEREQTPEWQAQKAADDAERAARHADSFVAKGID